LATAETKKDGLLDVRGFYPESFDCILLDPPCSALGLRPKLVVTLRDDVNVHARIQFSFVHQAVQLLKPKGFMTYSTCTTCAEENEEVVARALETWPFLRLVDVGIALGGPGLSGHGLDASQCPLVRRFEPAVEDDANADKNGWIGFFVAKFQKVVLSSSSL